MTAAEIRDLNFTALRDRLDARRGEVYAAFTKHGAATTRRLAELMGWDILSVRPRACELAGMGLLEEAGHTARGDGPRKVRETIYRPATMEEWEKWRAIHFPEGAQLQMGLNQEGALIA